MMEIMVYIYFSISANVSSPLLENYGGYKNETESCLYRANEM